MSKSDACMCACMRKAKLINTQWYGVLYACVNEMSTFNSLIVTLPATLFFFCHFQDVALDFEEK